MSADVQTDILTEEVKERYQKISESMLIQLLELCRSKAKGDVPKFSPSENLAIRLTWNSFLAGSGPGQQGIEIFLRMFKNHPETHKLFTFADTNSTAQMQCSSRLLFHVTRVVKYISRVIDNLEQLEEVVPMLKKLGGRHGAKGYNVPSNYFPYLGEALRQLMKESLPTFPDSTEQLWKTFFEGFIVKQIVEGQAEYGGK